MLAIGAESKKRLATEGAGVNRPKKKAKPKRPRGTKFINFTCELDTDNCVKENGLCIAHKTPAGKSKVGYLVNDVDAQLSCGNDKIKVDFKCDVCFHVFSIKLDKVTNRNQWCGLCSSKWEHCGVDTCTFCFERSIESYDKLTLNGKKKANCIVKKADLRLALGCNEKVDFKCDVCFHVFPISLNSVTSGKWCYMCTSKWKHCGVDTCTFCFERSLESYTGLTLNDKKKVDFTVNKADLRLALGSDTKVKFKCDVCSHVFPMKLANVSRGNWCPTCKNKTELMVLNFLQEMNITVVTQYIPGGMKQMKKNYGKFGKLDYYLPGFNILWELDGRQHNTQVAFFGKTTLFHRMILDKWKEYLVKKEGLNVIRFDQTAIWQNKYNWKQEMRNLLTFTSDKLRRQLKTTKKRYKMYAKQHNDKSKRRIVPEYVKWSHDKAMTPSYEHIIYFVLKYLKFRSITKFKSEMKPFVYLVDNNKKF